MNKLPCSIFNDVIGPVMRGPSSSHVAGGARIGELIRQSFKQPVKQVVCDFDPTGALAASHDGHGTDLGFACGLMGIDLSYPYVDQYETLCKERGLKIEYRILEYGAVHPGNYRVCAKASDGAIRQWEAISVGGGMIEMQKFDGFRVKIVGDFYELLVVACLDVRGTEEWRARLTQVLPEHEFCLEDKVGEKLLLNLKFAVPITEDMQKTIWHIEGVTDVVYLEPILPTHSSAKCEVPYQNAEQLLAYEKTHKMPAWKYATLFESKRGDILEQEVLDKMDAILTVMENAVDNGIKGTSYENRVLGSQASKIDKQEAIGGLVPCELLNAVIKSISAIMEVKSSMGLIVAAPTVGSCGCLPGTIIGIGRTLNLAREQMVQGLMVAGLIGVFIAEQATFSAEVGGCQVECGAASGMAAAAVTHMMGGTIEQCINAASMALQNITGLACDPVANRVEVPCLGKNIMGGSNAIASANMALAGFDSVIPLDETIAAIYEIGLSLPLELRCTFGGLGKTPTAVNLLEKMIKH